SPGTLPGLVPFAGPSSASAADSAAQACGFRMHFPQSSKNIVLSQHLSFGMCGASTVARQHEPLRTGDTMKRMKIWIPAGVLAMALVAWAFVRQDGDGAETFRLVAVEQGSIESVVTSTGVLQPTETVEVGTQVSGQIAELYVDFNAPVKKGMLLA